MQVKKIFNIKRQLNKPEYFFNPKQLIRRFSYKNQHRSEAEISIDNSGHTFFVNENEVIGRSILTMGVYDLIVAETIKRTLNPGDLFVDVGANVGYFSRLALAFGAQVESFEPHPKIFQRLQKNLAPFANKATLHNIALSDSQGEFNLYIPESFDQNEGIASLEPTPNSQKVPVTTNLLSNLTSGPIKLLKIDVEGHESSVLKGCENLLAENKIDFIIFEDFENEGDSETLSLLRKNNYSVSRLKKTVWGPQAVPPSDSPKIPLWEPPNYIASYSEQKIVDLFKLKKWFFYK